MVAFFDIGEHASLAGLKAVQLTSSNLEPVAELTGGSVKGLRLAPRDRRVDFWALDREWSASVGDWVVYRDGGPWMVMTSDQFLFVFGLGVAGTTWSPV